MKVSIVGVQAIMHREGFETVGYLDSRGIPNGFNVYPGRHDAQFVMRHFGDVMQFQWKAIGAGK